MPPKTSKASSPQPEDGSQSDSASTRDDEKTIPFLRRLLDMLMENEDVISFKPGYRKNGQVVLGKIIVHDRVKVESSILPKYFNHSSFASLRRQLNYFSFVRIGKGRQRGAQYQNDGVVELEDILSLKRRSVAHTNTNSMARPEPMVSASKPEKSKGSGKGNAGGKRKPDQENLSFGKHHAGSNKMPIKRLWDTGFKNSWIHQTPSASSSMLARRVSPVDNCINEDGPPPPKRISLDLTGASSPESTKSFASATIMPTWDSELIEQGAAALLCFSRGIPSR